ncbi:MAG: response regulator [Gemmatimonadota bacterium]|nr:response regulator [Gemmatimonadota bacterium]
MESVPRSGEAPLILVADDVEANVELLFDQLHVLGFRAIAATDGPSAVKAAFDHRPDLCILDVAMPAGDLGCDDRDTGFEVCRRIKRDPRTARVPVVFVTALSDTTDRVKAIEAGGDDFLTKPHNRLVLGARVRSLLRLKGAMDALEESSRKMRELEKLRDDLMKMIVHDLKSPLTSVLATLEMLRDEDFGPLTDGQRRAILDAEGKAEDLLALIEDLLEIRRIEETTVALKLEPIAPAALLHEIVHEWTARLRQAESTTAVDVPDDAPVFEGDKGLLRRVLGNLVQNAITHSAHPVHIQLSARRDGDTLLFSVADNGPGIPPEYQEVIFRKFEQVHTPNAPQLRGSGLGLAFCKLVVGAHGGRIWVQSAGAGQGSAFHFTVPLRAGGDGAAP